MGLFGGKKAAPAAAAAAAAAPHQADADGLRLEAADKAATTAAAPLDKGDDGAQALPPLDPRRRRLLLIACLCILGNEFCERLAYYSAQTNMVREEIARARAAPRQLSVF
jgi:hypothetical protein